MINTISLGNFKCFREEAFPLARFTLLSGVNGAGKSSVIQALLVLRQLCLLGTFSGPQVSLSGDLVDLGRAADILCTEAEDDVIWLRLEADSSPVLDAAFLVDIEGGEASWANLDEARAAIETMSEQGVALFNGGPLGTPSVAAFNYLNAERFGPRKALPMDDRYGRLFDVGKHGQYIFDALLQHQDRITLAFDDPRSLSTASSGRLRDQIEAWLDEVSPGVALGIVGVPNADLAVGSFTFGREGSLRSPEYRATNVGFGLSYILPVLAALLAAPADGLVLIENPEAHLHPRGQTKMGELCARAAAAGVQVIIETHSDHVLDGARLAVRDALLNRDDVNFHYLQQIDGRTVRTSPQIDADGRLSEWPEGFFDQHRRNAARLARPRRG
ncbi:AAA family ATPase [Methylorubrum extorquens]